MIESGERLDGQFALNYQWHDKSYVGAAHGLAGILFVLMRVRR